MLMGKKAKPQSKEHAHWVQGKAIGKKEGIQVKRDPITGEFTFPDALPGSVQSIASYRGNGKDKIIFAHSSKSSGAYADEYQQLTSNFDRLAVVDTNRCSVGGMSLSVGCAYYTKVTFHTRGVPWEMELVATFAFVNVSPIVNAEVLGWHLFINHVWPKFLEFPVPRVGLIVDSELGQHPAFNSAEKPYYRNHRLPPEMQLIYASSDVGRLACNKLMRVCDRTATQTARLICGNTALLSQLSTLKNGNEDHQGSAMWIYKDPPPGATADLGLV